LAAVACALEASVADVRAAWAGRGRPGTVHDYIDMVLAELQETDARPLPEGVLAATKALEADPYMRHLRETFGLTAAELQWLGLLGAAHVDSRVRKVLGYLDDDALPADPTPAAAAALWSWPSGYCPGQASAVARFGLASPVGGDDWRPSAPWALEADVGAFLLGNGDWWKSWLGLEVPTDDIKARLSLFPIELVQMAQAVTAMAGSAGGLVVEAVGPVGSGRRTVLRQLCAALHRPCLLVSSTVPTPRGLRVAALLGTVPIWEVVQGAMPGSGEPPVDDRPGSLTLVARATPALGPPLAAGLAQRAAALPPTRASFTLGAISRSARLTLWSSLAGADASAPPAIRDWTLLPAEIAAGAAAAPMGQEAVTEVCRKHLDQASGELLSPLQCPYHWDDLVVAVDVERALRDFEDQIQLNSEVLDDWGFARLTPTNRGVAALFAGPSGTGKTMAAQVLARSLNLDLYRVDLAQVVNKYIGETEKRLARLFDNAQRSNVMVFFDEADALFGQRTKVKDAHDRYANIEVDYLLQRIEAFDGVAVLATNRKGDLDPGFLRRLRVIIDFRTPTPPERLRLWEMCLPPLAPDGSVMATGIDQAWLAHHLELTCAEIKVVALNAAFRARAAGEPISQAHVLAAARAELAKRGTLLRPELLRPELLPPELTGAGPGLNGHNPRELAKR